MGTVTLPEAITPEPQTEQIRYVAIFANLLPAEVIESRQWHKTKLKVLFALAVLLVLLIGWYGFTVLQTARTRSELAQAQRVSSGLHGQETAFGPLVAAQSQSAAIKQELTKLMAGDLQWKDMLTTLRTSATSGVTITSVTGTTTAGAASTTGPSTTAGLGVLNESGKQQVGTLTITGIAPDKNAVAAYIDRLTTVKGLAAPFPASVTGQGGKLTFSANVIITSDALGGRFAPAPTTTQGGH